MGAKLIGVCEYDERWIYSARYSEKTKESKPVDIPTDLPNVIIVGEPMDIGLTATVPSALSGSATGMGIHIRHSHFANTDAIHQESRLPRSRLNERFCPGHTSCCAGGFRRGWATQPVDHGRIRTAPEVGQNFHGHAAGRRQSKAFWRQGIL